jgi:hypothetical protein
LVEAFNALRLFRRETEEAPVAPSRALGVAGVPAPAAELRGFAAPDKVPDSLETPELVRPPVAVPALAVAGVSTARALCIGEPGLGPPDGLVRVGDEGRWLCPPGFAACARAPRETTGRAGAVPVAGRARAGARDPSLTPVHDADAHDAAIVHRLFSKWMASKRVCLSHAHASVVGPRGTRGANAARRTRVWKRSAASAKDVRRW